MHSLPVFLRLKGRPVILIGTGEAAEAKRRLLERVGAAVVGEEEQATFAIVVDDEAAVRRLQARGILVNATDEPALCDFTLPAIVDRDPVIVAIGTGGASAGLAKALRQRLEAILPTKLGLLASTLRQAREAMRVRWPDPADRRRAIDAGMAPGGPIDPLGETISVKAWLEGAADLPSGRQLHIKLTSADPDDLTVRAARLLGQADRIFHRADVPAIILDRARADAVRILADAPPADPGGGLSLWLEMAQP